MVELLSLEVKPQRVNIGKNLTLSLYLYGDTAYCTIYDIMRPYKKYLNKPKIPTHNLFIKSNVITLNKSKI